MMKKEYSKRKFTIAVILSAILLLLISATTVHADANPLAKMPRKDSTVKSMYILPVPDAMPGMK